MIKINNLKFTYKNGTQALSDINLEINNNEIVAIIGKNGSGKTTLGHIISGIYCPKHGEVFLDELALHKKNKTIDIRKKVAVIFQNPDDQIVFNKVYDDISFTLTNLQVPKADHKQRIESALQTADMLDAINKNPFELSLGQKQRIAIANSLAIESNILVFDEATSMLDNSGKNSVYKLYKKLKQEGKTIVYITNILSEVVYADKIVILNKGKIEKILVKNELLDNLNVFEKIEIDIPLNLKLIRMAKDKNINLNISDENEMLNQLFSQISAKSKKAVKHD